MAFVNLEESIKNFALAATAAQQAFKTANNPLELSVYEFQFATATDTNVALDLGAQLGTGKFTDTQSNVNVDAHYGHDSQVSLMIHCVFQNPQLAEAFAAMSASANGLKLAASAPAPARNSGAGSGGGTPSGGSDAGGGGDADGQDNNSGNGF